MRPRLPNLLAQPKIKPFSLSIEAQAAIARILGHHNLSVIISLPEKEPVTIARAIEVAVSIYLATINITKSTTRANVLHTLKQLRKKGRARTEALELLASERAGVDYVTHNALHPLAIAVLAGEDVEAQLSMAVQQRAAEIAAHPRIEATTEALRQFCGVLRCIFNHSTDHLKGRITAEEAWQHCRRFAMEVMDSSGIDSTGFIAHPARLTEYLGTEVSLP